MKTTVRPQRFDILEKLGQGGTASVYKVRSPEFAYPAALKSPDERSDIDQFERLVNREFHLIGRLRYPGLVRILSPYNKENNGILLELCNGQVLEDFKPENIQQTLNILSAIAVNLEYLRTKKIIHCDLKEANIFLPQSFEKIKSGELFYLKLTDFSLARFEHESESDRVGLGTVGYSAPETIGNSVTSYQSDIFALGVIAYQLFSGKHPFVDGESDPVKINSKVQEINPTSLNQIITDLPDEISLLVDQMLSKNTSDRPESGWEVCKFLEKHGADYPYRKALRPEYCLDNTIDYDKNIEQLFAINDNDKERLFELTNGDTTLLRLVLKYNFTRGNLEYQEGKFNFLNYPLVPNFITKATFRLLKESSITEKKELFKKAVYQKLDSLQNELPDITYQIILSLLKTSTIKRLSEKYVVNALADKNFNSAVTLHIQAGQLNKAENVALEAAASLTKENKPDEAIALFKKIIRYALLTDNEFSIRQTIMEISDIYKTTGQIEEAEKHYNHLVELYQNKEADNLLGETYRDLGDLYRMKHNFNDGISVLEKALDIFHSLGNQLELGLTYMKLGNIHWMANNYIKSLSYLRIALKMFREIKADEETATVLNNIGTINAIRGNLRRAIKIFELSLKIIKELGQLGEIARALNNLGYAHHIIGDNDKAIDYLTDSLEYNRKIGSQREILINLDNLTSITFLTGNMNNTIAYLKEGITLSEELDDIPHQAILNTRMGAVLTRMGKVGQALNCFDYAQKCLAEIDDKVTGIILNIEKARMLKYLGDIDTAYKRAVDAFNTAEEINEKNHMVTALVMVTSIQNDPTMSGKLSKLIDELKLKREKQLFTLIQLENSIEQNDTTNALKSHQILREENILYNDIEQTALLNSLAEYSLNKSKLSEASAFIDNALSINKNHVLKFNAVKSLTLKGQIMLEEKQYENCFNIFRQALNLAKEISNDIGDNKLDEKYKNSQTVLFLVNQIKKLNNYLVQNK